MKFLACLLLIAVPGLCDTYWTLTGAGTNWMDRTPILDLTVPTGPDGEATSVTSWSSSPDPQFGDIVDYLDIYFPFVPGTPAGPSAPHGPAESLTTLDQNAMQPSGVTWQLIGMYGLDTTQLKALYSLSDPGDTPYGPLGPFTVADPPAPSVPEPDSGLLLLGVLPLLLSRKCRRRLLYRAIHADVVFGRRG